MSEFGNDTVAYIKQNFDRNDKNMQEHFKGKTIGEIIPELGFKVKYLLPFVKNKTDDIVSIDFVAIAKNQLSIINGIIVDLATPITAQNSPAAYNKLTSQQFMPFTKEVLDLIKDVKVNYIREEIGVALVGTD